MEDFDRGDFGECDVVSDGVFRLEGGVLFVNEKINYEVLDSLCLIRVEIRCVDKGGFNIEQSFNVSV